MKRIDWLKDIKILMNKTLLLNCLTQFSYSWDHRSEILYEFKWEIRLLLDYVHS